MISPDIDSGMKKSFYNPLYRAAIQYGVYGSTSFQIKKRKNNEPLNYRDYDYIADLNNYDENEEYIGHATLRMWRHFRGKKHHYLITIQDIPEADKYE